MQTIDLLNDKKWREKLLEILKPTVSTQDYNCMKYEAECSKMIEKAFKKKEKVNGLR